MTVIGPPDHAITRGLSVTLNGDFFLALDSCGRQDQIGVRWLGQYRQVAAEHERDDSDDSQ